MPKYKFDFMLNIWLQDVEIEAESYDKAEEVLYNMDVEDLIEEGYIKDYSLTEIDCEEEEDDEDEED